MARPWGPHGRSIHGCQSARPIPQGKLIVSVRRIPENYMRHPETTGPDRPRLRAGRCAAIRCQGLSDIAAIKGARVEIPVIGLWKEGRDGIYITPRCAMPWPA